MFGSFPKRWEAESSIDGSRSDSKASSSSFSEIKTRKKPIRRYNSGCLNQFGQHTSDDYIVHQAKFRFGDLPPELQLQILEFVILPGDVHLQVFRERWGYGCRTIERLYRTVAAASNIDDPVPRWVQRLDCLHLKCPSRRLRQVCGRFKDQQPGFGLMAMGKLLYQKGHPMFYGQNTFHLSPGPLALSTFYFSRLRPRHQNLIKSLAVTFTIADLTIEGFQEVELELREEKRVRNVQFKDMTRHEQVSMWTASSISVLVSTWRQKLKWLLTWPHLDRVTLSGPTWDLIVKGEDMVELFRDPMNRRWTRLGCTLGRFLQRSVETAREQLLAGFEQRGRWTFCSYDAGGITAEAVRWKMDVEGVKEWLSGLGPGVRYKPEPRWKVLLRSKKSMARSALASG